MRVVVVPSPSLSCVTSSALPLRLPGENERVGDTYEEGEGLLELGDLLLSQ